jgi:hypothetical protein
MKPFPRSLGNPYLVNFESSRSNDGETDPAARGGIDWEEEISITRIARAFKGIPRVPDIRWCMTSTASG